MHVLIDSDSIIFRCGFAVEHKKHKFFIKGEEHLGPFQVYSYKRDIPKEFLDDPELNYQEEVEIEPLQNALHLVKQELEGIISATSADSYSVYIKGKGNFREAISVTRVYKGNRDVTHRPKYEKEIREYLKEYWNAEEVDGMEVDDKCAIEQIVYGNILESDNISPTIIASIDKDMDQVPGWHYNFMRKEKYWINEDQATRNFYIQLLSGDPSDNIQGIKGLGGTGATKLVSDCKTERDYFKVCQQAYLDAYGIMGTDIMSEMANLVYLRRAEGESWQPPK